MNDGQRQRQRGAEALHLRKPDGPMALACGEPFDGKWFVREAATFRRATGLVCPGCLATLSEEPAS
jgi:hypothetical protein